MEEIAAGLWRWSAPHPRWCPGMDKAGGWVREVNSVAYVHHDTLVLIDPLVNDWSALDSLAAGLRIVVMLSAEWHHRSTSEVLTRYGGELSDRCSAVRSLPSGNDAERLLWLPEPRALVAGEVLTGSDAGLRVAMSPHLDSRAPIDAALRDAAVLPVRMVLPAHGTPVLERGAEEIIAALGRPTW